MRYDVTVLITPVDDTGRSYPRHLTMPAVYADGVANTAKHMAEHILNGFQSRIAPEQEGDAPYWETYLDYSDC